MNYSRAQNFEDVILWRALAEIDSGFYIDVGANEPEMDSVTKVFYDSGWSGINIEPVKDHYQNLCAARPRDINLRYCASDKDGTVIPLSVVPRTGLSTAVASVSELLQEHQYEISESTAETIRLDRIWDDYKLEEVHFLKIDVEGMEKEVLAGLDLSARRPWVIIVEAVSPLTRSPNHDRWEPSLLDNEYTYVYTDGINRFYLANEHRDLAPRFAAPPNVGDEILEPVLAMRNAYEETVRERAFFTDELERAKRTISHLETEQASKDHKINELSKQFSQNLIHLRMVSRNLDDILDSKVWRYTFPIRTVGPWFRKQVSASKRLHKLIQTSFDYLRVYGMAAFVSMAREQITASLRGSDGYISSDDKDSLTQGEEKILQLLKGGE